MLADKLSRQYMARLDTSLVENGHINDDYVLGLIPANLIALGSTLASIGSPPRDSPSTSARTDSSELARIRLALK